jgi:menaquinone-dependent protoporphyrinogen IX oxidase
LKNIINLKNIIATTVIILATTQAQVKIEKAIASTNTQWLGTKEITTTQVQVSVTNNNQLNAVAIEYSFDNVHFIIASSIDTSTNEKNYQTNFTHQSQDLTGKKLAFYRVKMVDNFGTVTYSNATIVGLEG